jgi:ABC-type uncharacterized transport system ATPase subunit
VIAGVLTPISGRIEIGGQPIEHASPRRMQELKVGRIPEDRMGVGPADAITASGQHGLAAGARATLQPSGPCSIDGAIALRCESSD